ncbi:MULTISPECIES: DUF2794 domain-containing protein [unclassified Devosia]|uniref:DUF2794 domain-containing protein n=1 Tax=unclassified Devosia TaxID=196773 RepID=UPI000AF57850|nr:MULTISPECIES: DUF2794 domain-containing protein [unclassified Devosia]MBN9362173.1 DUF2794 domain-containing protein [Devosia sp.]
MVDEPEQSGSALLIDFTAASPGAGELQPANHNRFVPAVTFDRKELQTILNLYGRKVVSGEWRDYALDFLRDRALFSIYKRASERPLYVVEKNPRLRLKQGQYMVVSQEGRVLKRGHDLTTVLRVLELALVK